MTSSEMRTDGDDLILFGVVGLHRTGGGSGGIARVGDGKRWRTIRAAARGVFSDPNGRTITITSHRPTDDGTYASMRPGAAMNTYLGTTEGKAALLARRHEPDHCFDPPDFSWQPVTLPVEGEATVFHAHDFAGGWWAAIGRIPAAVITIDSRGVPRSAVALERIPTYPVPALPDLAERGAAVARDLDSRIAQIPCRRVRNLAGYWALHAVETEHIAGLAARHGLSEQEHRALHAHWSARIDRKLGPTTERLRFQRVDSAIDSRVGRLLRGRNLLYQLWSNTAGPGARCWFGNRYTPIRRYTFRLRWRP